MIKIKQVIRTHQQIVFIFVQKLFKRAELRDKINVIKIKKVNRTDQQMLFISEQKLFKRAELRDKINVIEHNGIIRRKIMFRLKLWKHLQASNLYFIFGAML